MKTIWSWCDQGKGYNLYKKFKIELKIIYLYLREHKCSWCHLMWWHHLSITHFNTNTKMINFGGVKNLGIPRIEGARTSGMLFVGTALFPNIQLYQRVFIIWVREWQCHFSEWVQSQRGQRLMASFPLMVLSYFRTYCPTSLS